MSALILLLVCFVLGIVLRLSGRLPDSAPRVLNAYIINVALPALALLYVHGISFTRAHLFPVGMAWLLFACGACVFWIAGKALRLSRATIGCLILSCALGNTSFVGLPMIRAFYGEDGLGIGMLCDQPGTFLVLSTLGLLVAAWCSAASATVRTMARKIVTFPPLQAMVLAVVLKPVTYPDWIVTVLKSLGDTLAPLALISVGAQLRLAHLKGAARPLALGLLFKLLVGPALVTLVYAGLLGGRGEVMHITLFEAAMPPMITGAIVAIDHDLDAPLAALTLAIGIPLSFLTLPAWHWVLERI